MSGLDVPQNPEELLWYRNDYLQSSPSLLSGSEENDDGGSAKEISVIPPTPERLRHGSRHKKTTQSLSGRNLLSAFTDTHIPSRVHREQTENHNQRMINQTLSDNAPIKNKDNVSTNKQRGSSESACNTPRSVVHCSNASTSSHLSTSSSSSVSPMPNISNELSASSGDATSGLLQQILKAVQTSNDRVAELEKKLEDMQEEERVCHTKRKKIEPSPKVRFMVRRVYKTLSDEDIEFGYDLDSNFSSDCNKAVAKRLVKECKAQLPDVSSATIQKAARTYFSSCSGVKKLKTSGKYDSKVKIQRRKNRVIRKMQRCKAALLKTSALTEEEKTKWASVITVEMMSSEESAGSGSEDDGVTNMFIKHPLPWRSDKVSSLFKSLGHKAQKGLSKRSKQMTQDRVVGLASQRVKPVDIPEWAFKL